VASKSLRAIVKYSHQLEGAIFYMQLANKSS